MVCIFLTATGILKHYLTKTQAYLFHHIVEIVCALLHLIIVTKNLAEHFLARV